MSLAGPASTRRRKALNAAFVRSVGDPGKYHDGGGTGLYLRVETNGSRFWVQRIVIRGKRRELGLGSAAFVSLAEARDAAIANKRAVIAGGDPLRATDEAKAVPTFEEAARRVHELHRPTWRNPKHAAQFISTLETYAFPRLGARKVTDVTSADILAVLTPIWTAKAETARRVRQRIGTVLKWCVAQGWRQDNPAQDIERALPKASRAQMHRKALPYERVPECLAVIRGTRAGAATKLALEFLVLTAARSGEVRGARWSEIDLHGARSIADATRATWVLPAAKMKAKRDHRVPLAPRAIELLREAAALDDGSGLIFPGSRRGAPLSDMTLSKLLKENGFDADVHGFRTSFRTWAQEQTSFPREIAEAALAHVVRDRVEAAYARSDLFEKRREMLEAWATYVSQCTDGS